MKLRQQFSLLARHGFAVYFAVQFCGAFNDNLLRQGLLVFIAFGVAGAGDLPPETTTALGSLLFILPFLLLSPLAGHLADHFEKSKLIRAIKLGEVAIAIIAASGFVAANIAILMTALVLMGIQSALFATVKYSVIPELIGQEQLTAGNALVESATVAAIFFGSIAGGLLLKNESSQPIALLLIVVSIAGYLLARQLPVRRRAAATLNMLANPYAQARATLSLAVREKPVLLTMLGISWYWFLGVILLTQLPLLASRNPAAGPEWFAWLMSAVVAGTAIGSIACARLSGPVPELGLVPIGSLLMTVALVTIGSLIPDTAYGDTAILVQMSLLGFAGAIYVVPLYTLLQQRSDQDWRSRLFGANNLINAAMMCVALLMSFLLSLLPGSQLELLFLVIAIANIAVTAYIFSQVPEFLLRFIAWTLLHTVYRTRTRGIENIPVNGAALLICNHVSYMDAVVIAGSVRRPVRFVMHQSIFRTLALNFIFRAMRTIPITSSREDPQCLENAFATVASELEKGQLVCIFPEGRLTCDGEIGVFRPGVERILASTPVPVIPMALQNMWDSLGSRQNGHWLRRIARSLRPVSLVVAPAIPPEQATLENLRQSVIALRDDQR